LLSAVDVGGSFPSRDSHFRASGDANLPASRRTDRPERSAAEISVLGAFRPAVTPRQPR